MILFQRHKFQIISLILFAFIFYNGCKTTDIDKVESEDIHHVTVDKFYFAVTNENDTINLLNKQAELQKGNKAGYDTITYKALDSTGTPSIKKSIMTKDIQYIYAKYTYVDAIKIVYACLGGLAAVAGILFLIFLATFSIGKV